MRMMRWVLACVLSLGVAVQGYASVQAMDAGCPMLQPAPVAGMHDMHQMHEMAHDMAGAMEHVDDAALSDPAHQDDCSGSGAASKHCGCVTGCQPAGSSMALPLLPASLLRVQQAPVAEAPSFRSYHSFRHWRPPTLT